MNIFQQLDDIIAKKENRLANNVEDESDFQPFLVQRWLSMYSAPYAEIVNVSSNQLWRSMEDKQMWNKLFISVIPSGRNKRIKYIKKAKKKSAKAPDAQIVKFLAERLELSQREVKMYIDAGAVDMKKLKKQLNL